MPSLTLSPTPAAVNRKLAGFVSGAPLKLSATAGETIGTVMNRFNAYRQPENQITKLLTKDGLQVSFQSQVNTDLVAYVP
jgi:type VI protein secretion system component VasK